MLAAAQGVILVSAPPGYGKTTLVSGWLHGDRLAAGWVTLDESDNDPAVFLEYVIAAVRRAVRGIDPAVDGALASMPISATLAPLLNALGEVSVPLVIVLDDYHLVANSAVHEITASLARHLPPSIRIVLVTRHDPPLPLARLRARGQLTEIRAGNLRFTAEEAFRFLGGTMGLDVSEQTVAQLTERTEGWIAGLQLAALSLRTSEDPVAFVEAFGSSDRYIFDYLTDEALASLPPDLRSFLETTCVLDRLTGSLCDAITGRSDGAAMLAALAAANLFLTPLDERRDWYRYHGLFADLLASGLPPARRIELHRAAASWFAGQGLLLEGIRHHLAAHEPEEAAALMERAAELALARGEFRTFTRWCEALPAPTLSAHPVLGLMRAWALFFLGDIAGAEATLSQLDDDDQRDDRHGARRACLEAWFANRRDRPDSEALARRAIAGIPQSDSVFLSLAFTTLGESLAGRDVHQALAAFEEAHRLARVAGRSALLAGTVYSLATTDLVLGRRREAVALCRQTIAEQTGRSALTPPWLGMVHLPLGMALFEADELIAARQHIATGQELCDRAGLRVTMLGAAEWYEILGMHALGEGRQAWRKLEAVRREAERHGIRRVARAMGLLAAELLLLEGDPAGARARLEALPPPESEVLGATRDRGRLVEARVLLALDRPGAALEIAHALALEQRADGRLGRLMATLVVIASASSRAGDQDGSCRALAEALTHAADQGYRRVFRDPVLPVDRLLPHVRYVAPTFVDSLTSGGAPVGRPAPGPVPPRIVAFEDGDAGGPIERLSLREIEVLRLVAAGLSNGEIGRELFVSSGTAKWHVHNILGKLGSRNRAAVAARARSLGLI